MTYKPQVLLIPEGGTGRITNTAYTVITSGTTATGALQNVSGVGTVGQVLTSAGASALPVWSSLPISFPQNIGITYSGGTFTVNSADGTAFSSSNVGRVTLQSKGTPGELVTIPITANQTFTDGSGGTMDNARFGVTTGVNWAEDVPFFLYAVMDDTESLINFMVSRMPCATVSPANTSISKTGAIINVNQADFFSLDNITVTDYDSNPCVCIGSFRMQFAGATDSWTVQALNTTDGIGNFNDNHIFNFPSGQNGAAAGTWILSNAGTEPVFSTNSMTYMIQKNGLVKYNFTGITATAGVGAQTLQPVFPYAMSSSIQEDSITGRHFQSSTGSNFITIIAVPSSSAAATDVYSTGSAIVAYQNATIATSDALEFIAFYRAYTNTGL